jgi:hypothetical protein
MTRREDFEKWLDGEDFHGLCIDYRIASVEHTPDAFRDLRAGILTAALESQAGGDKLLRRMLCAATCGATAYMDDGEASDSSVHPGIDFLRDSPEAIQTYLQQRGAARWAESQAGKLTEAATLLEELGRLCSNAGGQLLKDAARDAIKVASKLRAIEAKTRE